MEPRIEIIKEKKLVGKQMTMSLSNNLTGVLWRNFMQQRREIKNPVSTDMYSLQIYAPLYFKNFDPNTVFEKWALVEVSDFESVPMDMKTFVLPSGLYAIFPYKGPASAGQIIFEYIFKTWLPNSGYELDNRPHFELLGEKYSNNSPDSEEEICVPIKRVDS